MRDVTNFNGVSLVLLQLLNMAEQRFVELRIVLFNFQRKDRRFNLHLGSHHIHHLHKGGDALSQRQIDTLSRFRDG